MMRKFLRKLANQLGYDIIKYGSLDDSYADLDEGFQDILKIVRPYTMTSVERMYSLYKSVEYIVRNKIEGDFVECGVWRGGSSMVIALTLLKFGEKNRKIYMYDTYEGMSEPTEHDVDFKGNDAKNLMENTAISDGDNVWCVAGIEDVKANVMLTKYPFENFLFIKGKVEDTIPMQIPSKISLLRLDTDWYESTYHEMKNLYPLLKDKGILIIDDYGCWQGARKAVDQFFDENKIAPMMHRIDLTGRVLVK